MPDVAIAMLAAGIFLLSGVSGFSLGRHSGHRGRH